MVVHPSHADGKETKLDAAFTLRSNILASRVGRRVLTIKLFAAAGTIL
jgi:hypothetical protein